MLSLSAFLLLPSPNPPFADVILEWSRSTALMLYLNAPLSQFSENLYLGEVKIQSFYQQPPTGSFHVKWSRKGICTKRGNLEFENYEIIQGVVLGYTLLILLTSFNPPARLQWECWSKELLTQIFLFSYLRFLCVSKTYLGLCLPVGLFVC